MNNYVKLYKERILGVRTNLKQKRDNGSESLRSTASIQELS